MPTNQRRIPTIFAILSLVVLMVGAVFLTTQLQKSQTLQSSADEPSKPENVGIANITDTSLTVYWTTQKEVSGAILFGTTPNLGGGIAVDERDHSGKSGQFTTHLVRLVNLDPETTYYFKISSGPTIYGDSDKEGAPFEVRTFPEIESAVGVEPIYGKFTDTAGNGKSGVVVLWTSPGGSPLSVLTKSDGSYLIPLSTARSTDGQASLPLPLTTAETIEFIDKSGVVSTLTCAVGQDKPLPDVKSGDTVSCQAESASDQQTSPGRFNPPTPSLPDTITVNITEGQTVVTAMPIITGQAPAGEIIRIQIDGKNNYSGTLKTGSNGNWSWTPPANLSVGENMLTVTIMTGSKAKEKLTRKFFAPGNDKILGVATGTPSAIVEHTACVNNACVKVTGTGADSCTTDVDCQPAPPPPVATPSPTPQVEPQPPITGTVENTLFALTWGVLFITLGVGAILFIAK